MTKKLTGIGIGVLLTSAACTTLTPTTISQQGMLDIRATIEDVTDAATDTNPAAMPDNGTATYSGNFTTYRDASEWGTDANLVGDIDLTADFDAGTISGSASNINVLPDPDPDAQSQLLNGSLTVSNGLINNTGMAADLTGQLTGNFFDEATTLDAELELEGDFYSSTVDGANSDIIFGSIIGGISMTTPTKTDEEFMYIDTGYGAFMACTVDCETLVP